MSCKGSASGLFEQLDDCDPLLSISKQRCSKNSVSWVAKGLYLNLKISKTGVAWVARALNQTKTFIKLAWLGLQKICIQTRFLNPVLHAFQEISIQTRRFLKLLTQVAEDLNKLEDF